VPSARRLIQALGFEGEKKMSIIGHFDGSQLRSMLRTSNYWANHNRNAYPVNMQNAMNALYEWVDCDCEASCECKNHGCTKHLVPIKNLPFRTYYNHFLACYVDQKAHDAIRNRRESGRGYKAIQAIEKWSDISLEPNTKSLICTQWSSPLYKKISKSFEPSSDTIYLSKWMALLSMGIYIAFDNGSVALLNRDYRRPKTYYDLLLLIRNDLISHLRTNKISIHDFCLYDNPYEFFSAIPSKSQRPIGTIIDKLYLTL
jgi:hypothetical protein